MAKSLNLCQFIGFFGKDPEISYMQNGNAVAKFSLACADDYKDKSGNKVEQTNWIRCVAFGRLAEIIGEYCRKGSKIYLSGKYTTRDWTDDQNVKHYTTEIVANEMQMLDGKQEQEPRQQSKAPQSAPSSPPQFDDFPDDSIPF